MHPLARPSGAVAEQAAVLRSRRPLVLLIRQPDPVIDNAHGIGAERGTIFDPAENRCRLLSRYERRAWVVRRVLAPLR